MSISIQQLEQLKAAGKIKGYTDKKPTVHVLTEPAKDFKKFGSKNKEWMKMNLEEYAKAKGLILATEFQFHTRRKFKFDFCLLSEDRKIKIGIEYEGLLSANGHQNGHTSFSGFTKDTIKYNLAQASGYIVFRYTANNYSTMFDDLNKLIP